MKLKKILKAMLKAGQLSPEEREAVFLRYPKWRARYGYADADGRKRNRALLVKTSGCSARLTMASVQTLRLQSNDVVPSWENHGRI